MNANEIYFGEKKQKTVSWKLIPQPTINDKKSKGRKIIDNIRSYYSAASALDEKCLKFIFSYNNFSKLKVMAQENNSHAIQNIFSSSNYEANSFWFPPYEQDQFSFVFRVETGKDLARTVPGNVGGKPQIESFCPNQETINKNSQNLVPPKIQIEEKNYSQIFKNKIILRQNNNFPKLVLNRFAEYISKSQNLLVDEQLSQLNNIFQSLMKTQFKKASLKDFTAIFEKSKHQHANRRLFYRFLTENYEFMGKIVKSKPIFKANKLKYLMNAKLAALRCRNKVLVTRIQTKKQCNRRESPN